MKLNMYDGFVAEGEPGEIAAFTFILLEFLKHKSDKEKEELAQKESVIFKEFGNMTFEELRRMEMGEDMDE